MYHDRWPTPGSEPPDGSEVTIVEAIIVVICVCAGAAFIKWIVG